MCSSTPCTTSLTVKLHSLWIRIQGLLRMHGMHVRIHVKTIAGKLCRECEHVIYHIGKSVYYSPITWRLWIHAMAIEETKYLNTGQCCLFSETPKQQRMESDLMHPETRDRGALQGRCVWIKLASTKNHPIHHKIQSLPVSTMIFNSRFL